MADDLDYALALSLQDQFDQEDILLQKKHEAPVEVLDKICDPKSIVDERWELADPNPNVHDLFVQFDAMFFDRTLTSSGVAVRWSYRMTLQVDTTMRCTLSYKLSFFFYVAAQVRVHTRVEVGYAPLTSAIHF